MLIFHVVLMQLHLIQRSIHEVVLIISDDEILHKAQPGGGSSRTSTLRDENDVTAQNTGTWG